MIAIRSRTRAALVLGCCTLAPGLVARAATLTVVPASGELGDTVTATGAAFPPGAAVSLTLGGVDVGSTGADPAGDFVHPFNLPALGDSPGGAVDLVAVGGGVTATAAFDLIVHERQRTLPFRLEGDASVAVELFSVTSPGTITAEIDWAGASTPLTASLTGRRRPGLVDPTTPHATASGASPLTLTYDVTADDLRRGVAWRLILSGPAVAADATGNVRLTTPFDAALEADFQREKIALRSGEHWPSADLQQGFLAQLAAPTTDGGLHGLISLATACDCQKAGQLERLGLVRLSHLPGRHAFGLVRSDINLGHPVLTSALRGLTPLEPEDKVDPHLLVGNYRRFVTALDDGSTTNYALNLDGTLELLVLFASDASPDRIATALGARAVAFDSMSDHLWQATVAPTELLALAADDAVEWIEAGPAPDLLTSDRIRTAVGAEGVQNARKNGDDLVLDPAEMPIYDGWSGRDITVGVDDSGIDGRHDDLDVVFSDREGRPHGTLSAGIIAASGYRSDRLDDGVEPNGANKRHNGGLPFQWRGMAPEAALYDSADLIQMADLQRAIDDFSLDVWNRSKTVGPTFGLYDPRNRQIDQAVRGGATSGGKTLGRRAGVVSVGNLGINAPGSVRGYFSTVERTKNAISVGGWNHHDGALSHTSSLGPTHDGRIKPDLVAPSVDVVSTATVQDEEQCLGFANANGLTDGTFTLTYGSETTMRLSIHAAASVVESALRQLSGLGPVGGIESVTVHQGGALRCLWRVVFEGSLSQTDVAELVMTGHDLEPATALVAVAEEHPARRVNSYVRVPDGGTSAAAPVVSGTLALLLDGWNRTYTESLDGDLDLNAPLPSTLRALLVQTADDIVCVDDADCPNGLRRSPAGRAGPVPDIDSNSDPADGNDHLGRATATVGPDFTTGWGLVDAAEAADLLKAARETDTDQRIPKRIWQRGWVGQGVTQTLDFVVEIPGALKVTLAWDDVEGSPMNLGTGRALVNDLDLELIYRGDLDDPMDDRVVYPWQLGQETYTLGAPEDALPLPPETQTPGTAIDVRIPIRPMADASLGDEYVPASALTGEGAWVARRHGRDHLNTVEQVAIDDAEAGHWTVRVVGFDVPAGPQSFSVVGFPYPDLPELVASGPARATIESGEAVFTWAVRNVGPVATGGGFDYRVLLSHDLALGGDVVLVDSAARRIDELQPAGSPGDWTAQVSRAQIGQAALDAFFGTPGKTADDLVDADAFLLVQVDSGGVDSGGEILEHQEQNLAAIPIGREVDVVLVSDRSGSMKGDVVVSNGTRRKIDLLADSLELFVDVLRKGEGDRIAAVSFSAPNDLSRDQPLTELTTLNAEAVREAIVAPLEPATSTDIRGGLELGLAQLPPVGTDDPDRRRVLIFFSDGEKTAGGDPEDPAFLDRFEQEEIRVYSVGYGTPGGTVYTGIDLDLLNALAGSGVPGGSFSHVTDRVLELDKFFVNALAGAIDAQVVIDPVAELAPAATDSVDVRLGAHDRVVNFVVTWDDPGARVDLAVLTPSGHEIRPDNATRFGAWVAITGGTRHARIEVRAPTAAGAFGGSGTWTMRVGNGGPQPVRYSASAMTESSARAEASVPAPARGTAPAPGLPLELDLSLEGTGGVPISGARVTATPTRPLVALGDLLASGVLAQIDLSSVPTALDGDALSPVEQLVLGVVQHFGGDPLPVGEGEPLELTEGATPGTYVGVDLSTDIDGPYGYVIRAEGLTADCEPLQREISQTTSIPNPVDAANTEVTVTAPGLGSGTVTITVTPFNTLGRFVGPGFERAVKIVTPRFLEPETEVTDRHDGSYSQTFDVRDPGLTEIELSFAGIPLPTAVVDLDLAAPTTVKPEGVTSDREHELVVGVTKGFDLSAVTGVEVSGPGKRKPIPLSGVRVDERRGEVRGVLRSSLAPGRYRLRLVSRQGPGPFSVETPLKVIGGRGELPEIYRALDDALDTALRADTSPEHALRALGDVLRHVRLTPTGRQLTQEHKDAAIVELVRLITRRPSRVKGTDLPRTLDVRVRSKLDATDSN